MSQNPFDFLPLISAGFRSPADDYLEPDLDYNAYLKRHPSSVKPWRVNGDCMKEAHIPHSSIVVIDRSIKPVNGGIVAARVDGENMIKQIVTTQDGSFLLPANKRYRSIHLTEGADFNIWGTVTHVIIDLHYPPYDSFNRL